MGELTQQQQAFCINMVDMQPGAGNATQAYLKAYPDSSKESATSSAATLLALPNIETHIQSIRDKQSLSVALTRERIAELRSNIANDTYKPSDALTAMKDHEKAQGWLEPEVPQTNILIQWGEADSEKNVEEIGDDTTP